MCYLYASLIPEALIVSMLPPEQFAAYYASGSQKRSREQAIFFELDPAFRHPFFRLDEGVQRCVPHEDGSPKRSIYVGVYRVLEHLDLNAIRKLHLVTQDGRSLALEPSTALPNGEDQLHLYQEIAPVHPLVASSLAPSDFFQLIVRSPISLLQLPAIAFVELKLGELARDPLHGLVKDLPYPNIEHVRDCLVELKGKSVKAKMINRIQPARFAYRTIKNGLYFGNEQGLVHFPVPSEQELRDRHYDWWRSIQVW